MSTERLSREVILKAAMELVADGGFEALTVRRLARRLQVTPMAMYRHFDGKAALIGAILDRATAEIAIPPADVRPREALSALAREIRSAVITHAPLVPALVSRPSLGPGAVRLADRGEAALREAGLSGDAVGRAWNLIAIYALGFAIVEAPRTTLDVAVATGDAETDRIDAEDITLATELSPPTSADLVSDAQFEYGLRCLLAGVLASDGSPSGHASTGSERR
jgi:AcrR family transcriptional regulator